MVETVDEMKKVIRRAMPWVKHVSRMNKAELKHQLASMRSGSYLVNDGMNSCYLDSLWVAFFAPSLLRRWVSSVWLSQSRAITLRNQLRQIHTKIVEGLHREHPGTFTCTPVRKTLASIRESDIDWLRSQNDPNEVIQALIQAFHQKPDVRCKRNTPSETHHVNVLFNAIMVGPDLLWNKKRVVLKQHVFKRYKENDQVKLEIEDAKCLYIPVMRNYLDEEKLTTRVYASENVTLATGIEMELCSIILHLGTSPHGGHYTCCFKKAHKWYMYDDLRNNYKLIKDIRSEHIQRNATAFIYARC